jgi:hypothetical protein
MVQERNALVGLNLSYETIEEPKAFDGIYHAGKFHNLDASGKITLSGEFVLCAFTEANLKGCVIRGKFTKCSFAKADFTDSDWTGAIFSECDFEGSIIKNVKGVYNATVKADCTFNKFVSSFNVKRMPHSRVYYFIMGDLERGGGNVIIENAGGSSTRYLSSATGSVSGDPYTPARRGPPQSRIYGDFSGFNTARSEWDWSDTPVTPYKPIPRLAVLLTSDENELNGKD